MKYTSSLFALVFGVLSACGAPMTAMTDAGGIQLAPGTATIEVEVSNVRSATGHVACALFNSAAGFPGPSPIAGGGVSQPAVAGAMHCRFADLPAGDYAVSVVHDENDNGTLDRNAFGAPTEGYGASNNVLPALSAPTFDDSRLHVADGQQVTARIDLRY